MFLFGIFLIYFWSNPESIEWNCSGNVICCLVFAVVYVASIRRPWKIFEKPSWCVRYSFTDSRRSETEKTHIKQGMKKSFVFFSFFVSNASRACFVGKVVRMDDALLMAWLVCCYSIQISLPFNRFGPRKKATALYVYIKYNIPICYM